MDNFQNDPSLNDPLSLVGSLDTPVPLDQTGQFAQPDKSGVPQSGGQQIPGTSGPPTLDPTSLLGDLASVIPGFNSVVNLISAVTKTLGSVESGITEAVAGHPIGTIQSLIKFTQHIDKVVQLNSNELWSWIQSVTIDQLFESYLRDGLNINTDDFTGDEKAAVQTIDSMLGFSVLVHFVASGINAVGSALLANRWDESVGPIIASLPESMGLTWALGLAVDESFKQAQGVILEEAINKQKRPQRIAWPQIRLLLKQHAIKPDEFKELMALQGFPDTQIDMLAKLQDVAMPVGDIAQLWYREIYTDEDAKLAIKRLGFSDKEADDLFTLYMDKSENEASVTYRTVARQLFEAHLIAEDQYKAILEKANFPKRLIDQDVAAIKLLQETGRLLHSVTEIKTRYQHGAIDDKIARTELQELNYADNYISELLQSWNEGPLRRTHGLSQSKILSYLISGALTPDQARTQLSQLGLTSEAVDFLIAHPSANAGTHQRTLSPSLVTQAFIDGLIPIEELDAALKGTGVKDKDVKWYHDVALYKMQHKKNPSGPFKSLDKAEILDAWKYGLMNVIDASNALLTLGYAPQDTTLLLEIKNKGIIKPGAHPAFASVQDAIAYLQNLGWTIEPPPDPTLVAAEAMVEGAGYTIVPPPPYGRGPGGGTTAPPPGTPTG